MKISTFGFLTRRGVRNLGKHWAMTIACIASLSVCMTLNIFASLIEVNVDSMVSYLGSQNEMVVYVDPEADDATIQSVGNALSGTAGVSRVQYMSKEDVLNQYKGYMSDYAALLNEFENDNPFKANYRVSLSDLNQMETISKQFENISGVYSVTAPIEMTKTFVEIQQAVTKVGRGVVLVLMAVSIITVGTTIRLSVFARRREIEIMKYVGATNALVTLPFVIEGLTMGLLSGILSGALVNNTIAIIVTCPIAKEIGGKFGIAPKRLASLVDIFACAFLALMPHDGGILIITELAGCTPLDVLPYSFYMFALIIATCVTIQFGLLRTPEEKAAEKEMSVK